MQTYYLYVDNQVQGPYSEAEVKVRSDGGALQADSQVRAEGGEWGCLADILPSLFPPLPASTVCSVAPTNSIDTSYKASEPPTAVSSEPSPQTYEGIGRLAFFGAFIGIAFLGGIISAATGTTIATVVTLGLMLIPASSRLQNIGRNPSWCVLLLVPLLGLFITVPCFMLPAGYQDHRKLDLAAKIFVGFLVLLVGNLIWAFSKM